MKLILSAVASGVCTFSTATFRNTSDLNVKQTWFLMNTVSEIKSKESEIIFGLKT
jgi:hypothetical protein